MAQFSPVIESKSPKAPPPPLDAATTILTVVSLNAVPESSSLENASSSTCTEISLDAEDGASIRIVPCSEDELGLTVERKNESETNLNPASSNSCWLTTMTSNSSILFPSLKIVNCMDSSSETSMFLVVGLETSKSILE